MYSHKGSTVHKGILWCPKLKWSHRIGETLMAEFCAQVQASEIKPSPGGVLPGPCVKSSRSVKLFLHETPSIFPSSHRLVTFDPATLTLRLFVLIGCFLTAIVILHLLRLKHKNFDDWTIEDQRLSVEGHVLLIKDLQRNHNPASTMHRQSWGKGFWEIFHIKTCLNTWNRRQRIEMGNSHRQRGMATYPRGCGDASSCCVITGLENTV